MANISQNLVNVTLSDAEAAAVNTALQTLLDTLSPHLHTLTDMQRNRLQAMNVDNKVFAEQALSEINANGEMLPPAISGEALGKDIAYFGRLNSYESQLLNLLQRIRDTKRMAGHEAYAMALAARKMFNSLAETGVPGAQQPADRINQRFDNGGRSHTKNWQDD